LHPGEQTARFSSSFSNQYLRSMSSSGSCGCTWMRAGLQPAAIPASQLSLPVLSPHAVRVRVLAGAFVIFVIFNVIIVLFVILKLFFRSSLRDQIRFRTAPADYFWKCHKCEVYCYFER
jgi:hypothetical protein